MYMSSWNKSLMFNNMLITTQRLSVYVPISTYIKSTTADNIYLYILLLYIYIIYINTYEKI